jgi:hypothetical protein
MAYYRGEVAVKPLSGWQRIGIILSVLWALLVSGYAAFEYISGPDSAMLLIEMVVSKTGDPITILENNAYRDLVPVQAQLRTAWFLTALLTPIAAAWLLAYVCIGAVRWVVAGFRSG